MQLAFPAEEVTPGTFQANVEDVWDAAKAYARGAGHVVHYSHAEGLAPF